MAVPGYLIVPVLLVFCCSGIAQAEDDGKPTACVAVAFDVSESIDHSVRSDLADALKMILEHVTFGGKLVDAHLDIMVFPFNDKVLQDEIHELKSIEYTSRTSFMDAEMHDITAILQNITGREMTGLTDFTSVLEFVYDHLCVGSHRYIIIISDFIATLRTDEIQGMLDKITADEVDVVPIVLDKVRNEDTFKMFKRASGMSVDLRGNDTRPSVEAIFGAQSVKKGSDTSLPPGCTRLDNTFFSQVDQASFFEANSELSDLIPPQRTGNLRQQGALPTHHFVINQLKVKKNPLRLFPYSGVLTPGGATYDAYTLERWRDPVRSDEMLQQTPSEAGKPWAKILSVGTNLKQMVSGPDGNPKGLFTGKSGIQIGLASSGDPTMTDFGLMYANFLYSDKEGGSMEVPLVRGQPLLTHRFTNANPRILPYCLSSINGRKASYSCPMENSGEDRGTGYIDAQCSGDQLTINFRATKAVELKNVQYAATPSDDWGERSMITCTPDICLLGSDGKTVTIRPGGAWSAKEISYAVNVIEGYVVPQNWTSEPNLVSCHGPERRSVNEQEENSPADCGSPLCQYPSCTKVGDSYNFSLRIVLQEAISGPDKIQFAVSAASSWKGVMLNCGDSSYSCQMSDDKREITFSKSFDEIAVKYAINVVDRLVAPPGDWNDKPYEFRCDGSTPLSTVPPPTWAPPTGEPPKCGEDFCQRPSCSELASGKQQFTLVMQFKEAVESMDKIQMAISPSATWKEKEEPMMACTPELCVLSSDKKTIFFHKIMPTGAIKYALNYIGKFTQPPNNWQTLPFQYQCGGGGVDYGSGTKFLLELDEPGEKLPQQTRKFVLYFSSTVKATLNANGVDFAPPGGGKYTGLVQLAYNGASDRGDTSMDTYHDQFAGIYSYKPDTTYCYKEDKGYINVNWNKHNKDGPTTEGEMFMIALPHQEALLSAGGELVSTPYGFKGIVADEWLMEEELPRASMEPDPSAVAAIKANAEQNAAILAALDRDTNNMTLAAVCPTADSYGVGKSISMAARLASISRAFNTDHYRTIDPVIRSCLDKWLRINDTLLDNWKFRYDTVWGGLLLRGVNQEDKLNPGANYGFPVYNDHHFHMGYFVYAMAYYATYYPAFGSAYRERILALARDVGNPSQQDPYFPIARHKDWYMGLSWASGVIPGDRQEESSSEGMNCYHGIAALGLALNMSDMKAFGQLMLATEIRSVREYFHVRAHNRNYFPPYIREYGTIGMVDETNIFLYTLNWPCDPNVFPARHACLVGIQVIPITAISKYYQDKEWAASIQKVCSWSINPNLAPGSDRMDPKDKMAVVTGWAVFCHSAMAPLNETTQRAAADYVKDLNAGTLVPGTGVASTLLFIYGGT